MLSGKRVRQNKWPADYRNGEHHCFLSPLHLISFLVRYLVFFFIQVSLLGVLAFFKLAHALSPVY